METRFGRQNDVALARERRARRSRSTAGQSANDRSESGAAASADQGTLAATFAGLLELRGINGIFLAVNGDAVERESQNRAALQATSGLRLDDCTGGASADGNDGPSVDRDRLGNGSLKAIAAAIFLRADALIEADGDHFSSFDDDGSRRGRRGGSRLRCGSR